MDDSIDLKSSSFINVTLAFWTNENGLAIAAQQTVVDTKQTAKKSEEEEPQLLDENKVFDDEKQQSNRLFVASNQTEPSVQNIISSLFGEQFHGFKNNESLVKNTNGFQSDSLLADVSNITRRLFDNISDVTNDTLLCPPTNLSANDCVWRNDTQNLTTIGPNIHHPDRVYWALFLVILPILALFGNILVILSVYRERTLQTVTNWFIVSLAFADLFVTIPMVFSLYVMVNVDWELSEAICDLYIAIDVICSTASIFNLVAISFDRYIAVTHPIFYSKHKNDKRVIFTIVLVWMCSAGVGLPIVLGANTSADRIPELCIFYNSNFIIYSSLWSFYVPCVIMVILYYKIFKAIHDRAKKAIGSRKTYNSTTTSDTTGKSAQVIENIAQTKRFRDELQATDNSGKPTINNRLRTKLPLITETDAVTNAGSGGSGHDDDDDEEDKDEMEMVECHVIKNVRAQDHLECYNSTDNTNLMLKKTNNRNSRTTVVQLQSPVLDTDETVGPNGNTNNTDSGYVASHIEDCIQFCVQNPNADPIAQQQPNDTTVLQNSRQTDNAVVLVVQNIVNKNGNISTAQLSTTTSSSVSQQQQQQQNNPGQNHSHQKHNESVSHSGSTTGSTTGGAQTAHRPAKKKSRFNLGRKHKSTRKKREKASAKRERKATKTLAIVLGVFLLCWTPFFSCNILDAICIKLDENDFIKTDCRPGMTAFLLTTWLGYMNSCANPLIYTIFNPVSGK